MAPLFARLDAILKLAAGAKLRLARKLDDAGAAQAAGADTAEFLATTTGTSVGAARDVLATSQRLATQHHIDRALAGGQLSDVQATVVADAVAVDPTAEPGLLHAAGRWGVRDLKAKCAQTKANAHPDPAARRDAIRRSRSCRTWTDLDGAWHLHLRHLPDVGAEIDAPPGPLHPRPPRDRPHIGVARAEEAYRADAMLDLARATKTAGAVPLGPAEPTPRCSSTSTSPPSRPAARNPGRSATSTASGLSTSTTSAPYWEKPSSSRSSTTPSTSARSSTSAGRSPPQRSALEARGYAVPGCCVTWALEIDHRTDWALTGTTTLDELVWLCRHHHDQKTHHHYRITGPPGHRTWTAPDGTTHHADHHPPAANRNRASWPSSPREPSRRDHRPRRAGSPGGPGAGPDVRRGDLRQREPSQRRAPPGTPTRRGGARRPAQAIFASLSRAGAAGPPQHPDATRHQHASRDATGSQPGFCHTETWLTLSLVNGSRRQPPHRSSSVIPASRAMRSSSAGHAGAGAST